MAAAAGTGFNTHRLEMLCGGAGGGAGGLLLRVESRGCFDVWEFFFCPTVTDFRWYRYPWAGGRGTWACVLFAGDSSPVVVKQKFYMARMICIWTLFVLYPRLSPVGIHRNVGIQSRAWCFFVHFTGLFGLLESCVPRVKRSEVGYKFFMKGARRASVCRFPMDAIFAGAPFSRFGGDS